MRRLVRSKRAAGEEAVRTLPYTALAGILVLFTIGLMVRWFWMLFIAGPSIWDGYATSNFDRLGEEVGTMLETGKWHEARVIPFSFISVDGRRTPGNRRAIVGINPGLPLPGHAEACSGIGEELKINKVCKRYPCLCFCHNRDCTDKNNCIVFKKSEYDRDVRFVGLDQGDFNIGRSLPEVGGTFGEDTLHELMLVPFCNNMFSSWGGNPDSYYTGNLYIEETRSEDGRYSYILIAREDEVTGRRDGEIEELGRKEECNDAGAKGTGTCYDLNCCEDECKTSAVTSEVYCGCMPRGTKGGMEAKCEDLDCCDDCEYDETGQFPECVRIRTGGDYPTGGGGWQQICGIENPVKGIDVSHHQGEIDWNRVANDGIEFAFIRASYADDTEDRQFSRNWREAKANGIKRGAYHFFRADMDAEVQADLFLRQLGSDYGEFPPVIDVEMDSTDHYEVSRERWIDGITTWIDIVESRTGMRPIIYTSPGFWSGINTDTFSDHTLWTAHWEVDCPGVPSAWGDWVFWQWCDGCLAVDGIKNPVDANVFNGDTEQLVAYVQQARVI